LFYDVSEEILIQRCTERAKTSGREDDNLETLVKRFNTYKEMSKPVIEFYDRFGKVCRIDASQSVKDVYECTKQALLPEVYSLIGPKCSGKRTVGMKVAERANLRYLDFERFLKAKKLTKASDEDKMREFVNFMYNANETRFLALNFPQNSTQANYFV